MTLIEMMGSLIENLEIGDSIEIYITQNDVLFHKIFYNPKDELFIDHGWEHRLTTKERKKRMHSVSLSNFIKYKKVKVEV